MRKKIDAADINIKGKNVIYESPDGGKTVYRSEIDPNSPSTAHVYKPTAYDDVSGIKIDDADENAIGNLSRRVLELEELVTKIRNLVR